MSEEIVVESPEPVDAAVLLWSWREAPHTLSERVSIARDARMSVRTIAQLAGLERRRVRRILRQVRREWGR